MMLAASSSLGREKVLATPTARLPFTYSLITRASLVRLAVWRARSWCWSRMAWMFWVLASATLPAEREAWECSWLISGMATIAAITIPVSTTAMMAVVITRRFCSRISIFSGHTLPVEQLYLNRSVSQRANG